MKKNLLSVAVATAIGMGVAGNASAAAITGIQIKDVGSTLNGVNGGGAPGTYSSALDGRSAGFRFAPINPTSYLGVSGWTGDVGTGTLLGGGAANATGSFSTGFLFAGQPFVPYTFGSNFSGDITGGALTVSSMDFGGNFAGVANFNLPPDAGSLKVNWVNQTSATTYDVSFQWEHYITPTDDPSYSYVGFTARWLIEGTATVAGGAPVPVPAAAWLFGSGIIGLAGVARRRRNKA